MRQQGVARARGVEGVDRVEFDQPLNELKLGADGRELGLVSARDLPAEMVVREHAVDAAEVLEMGGGGEEIAGNGHHNDLTYERSASDHC